MPIVYFDSSAFVKLVVEEDGSDLAATLWDGCDAAVSNRLTAHAGELAGQHSLRAADAVHLASLLAVGAAETLFAVWDHQLRAGAQTAGVQLAPAA